MSWSITIPERANESILREAAIAEISMAPDAPDAVDNMAAPQRVLEQVKLAKHVARAMVVACDYEHIRIYLNGHVNADGIGDNWGVSVHRVK